MRFIKIYRKNYLAGALCAVFFLGTAIGFFIGSWRTSVRPWVNFILRSEKLSNSDFFSTFANKKKKDENLTHAITQLENDNALKELKLAFLKNLIDTKPEETKPFSERIDAHIESMKLGRKDLFPIVGKYLDLIKDDSPQDPDLKRVASKLATLAVENILYPTATESANRDDSSAVNFSSLVDQDNHASHPQNDFFADDVKIYASFGTGDYEGKNVLVKWYKSDTPDLLLFDKYPISQDKTHNYVWLKKPKGWAQGSYGVEIYSANINDNLKLIARGMYNVW